MKKFMKAIAFVTVMCMALSTVAFAANSVPGTAEADKTFVVTVTEAGANDQVALMVVDAAKEDYDFSDPLYIDQKGATNGAVEFTAKIARDVDEVAVYVGYAANGANPAIKVGTVKLVQPITEVTIEKVDTKILQATEYENLIGAQQVGAGVAIKLDVEAPAGVTASKMIWAIRYEDETGAEKVKYTDSFDKINNLGIGGIVEGSVTLGLAFLNGFTREGEEINPVKITGVDVIFLFEGANNFRQEVFTNDADKKPEN